MYEFIFFGFVETLPVISLLLSRRTLHQDTPGADALAVVAPHNATGTVLYNHNNIRFSLSTLPTGYLQQG